jgi:hypothetical protein
MSVAAAMAIGLALTFQIGGVAQSSSVVMVGAGDIVPDCNAGASTADAQATATLVDAIPGSVFVLGDNSYENGTRSTYINCYDPTWGRHKARTRPVTGNHEYQTAGASGYFDYFDGVGVQTGPAGDRGKGYYSYDVGSWHVVVLNSECGSAGLWDVNGCAVGSPQEQWLRADLAASPTNNIIAMFHKPRYSSGWREASVQPLWQALYEAGADLVLNGHVHYYERLAPAGANGARDNPYGIRQLVVGTGGRSLASPSTTPLAISELNDGSSFGVIKLMLFASSYTWQFIPTSGGTLTDGGTGTVHGPPPKGLVANWQMEENGGKTLLDSSGFANNAAITGTPSWVTGHSGLAVSLNGSTYAAAPDTGLLNSNILTLAAWVNPARVATQYVVKKTNAWELGLSSTGVPFFRLNNSATFRIDATSPQANGSWMHLAGTFDGSRMHFYVNGVEQGPGIAGPAVIAAVTAGVGIGAQSDGGGKLKGLLDDVRIYNIALSAADIQTLATSGNAAPVVNAGPDQTITLPAGASLSGLVTDDGLPNPPGTLTTTWSQVSGPGTTTFANASATSTTATFSAAGTYTLQLSANDGALISTDRVVITVSPVVATNQAPVVNAGPDQTITLPAGASLSGTVTDDGLPNPPGAVTTTWSQVSGPGTTTFANPAARSTTATFSVPGSYTLQLAANDGSLTGTDTVVITVNPATSATLVGYWKADEGSGTVLVDSSGAGNSGTINLTPTWVTGHLGLGIRFGASAYVTVPSVASLNMTGAVTIAAWIRPEATATAYTQCLIKKGSNTVGAYDIGLSPVGKVFVRLNNSTTFRVDSATSYPTNGTWMHVAATYDGTTIRLYVNGVLERSVAGPAAMTSNTLALGIGATADAVGKYKGAIDEARIYNGALSASDIQALARQ